MGGGDLNAKKAWHPNTLKNQERVWKAEQAAAEEKKRILELERERQLEREKADLNKLARNNIGIPGTGNDDRLHWMYEKPDKKVQQEEYLLGKAIDKNHDPSGKSEADEIPAVSRRVVGSSMLTISGDTQVDLARKMREDPLLLVKERERAARAALLNNPIQRARLTELLRKEQENKKESKSKKEKKKGKDLDIKLAEKLQAISGTKKVDLATLLASGDSSSESSDEEFKKKKKKKTKKKKKSKRLSAHSESEEERKSNIQSKRETKKRKYDDTESEGEKKKRNHTEKESRNHKDDTKRRISDSEDDGYNIRKKRSRSVEKRNSNLNDKKEYNKNVSDGCSSDNQKDYRKSKAAREFRNTDKGDRYSEGYKLKSKHDLYSSIDKYETKGGKYSKSEQQTKDNQYCSNKHVSNDNKDSRYKKEKKDNNRKWVNQRADRNSRDDLHSIGNIKAKDKGEWYKEENMSSNHKEHRGNKRSGLSEEEKAAKLAEMVLAGAEREKQRERRVAQQLAEKEKADQPSASHARSRNVINQLPDSLESRIHSNRHYIQRDQRHMNEHFARR